MAKENTKFVGAYIPEKLADWAVKKANSQNLSLTSFIINILKEKKNGKKD